MLQATSSKVRISLTNSTSIGLKATVNYPLSMTMEAGDVLYGITMEEPGISKIVSVRLREAQDFAANGPEPETTPPDTESNHPEPAT